MEKSASTAGQRSTQGLERLRDRSHDAIQSSSSRTRRSAARTSSAMQAFCGRVPRSAALWWAAWKGWVSGEADGVRNFGSEEHATRVQEECAPIARFFVQKASQFLDDVGQEHGWFIALLKAQTEGKSTIVRFWDKYTIDEVSSSELTFLPNLVEFPHVRCLCSVEPEKKIRRREMLKGSLWTLRP